MFADLIPGTGGKRAYELLEIVTLKEGDTAAALAEKQVLMAFPCSDEGLTTPGLVDALDQVQFLQLFKRAVDGYQSQGAITLAGRVIDLDRGQRVSAARDGLDHGSTGPGESMAIFRELGKPKISGHWIGNLVIGELVDWGFQIESRKW